MKLYLHFLSSANAVDLMIQESGHLQQLAWPSYHGIFWSQCEKGYGINVSNFGYVAGSVCNARRLESLLHALVCVCNASCGIYRLCVWYIVTICGSPDTYLKPSFNDVRYLNTYSITLIIIAFYMPCINSLLGITDNKHQPIALHTQSCLVQFRHLVNQTIFDTKTGSTFVAIKHLKVGFNLSKDLVTIYWLDK